MCEVQPVISKNKVTVKTHVLLIPLDFCLLLKTGRWVCDVLLYLIRNETNLTNADRQMPGRTS